jgi:UDP-glucose 4-epimerase
LKILVSGFKGFIGSHLTERLLDLGHEVVGIDNGQTDFFQIGHNHVPYKNSKVKVHKLQNLCNSDSFDLKGIDVVFHVAAIARIPQSYETPHLYYQNNILSTLNLLEACRKRGVKKFIYSSSSSVVDPSNPYAHSKLIGEELCEMYSRLYGMNIQCLRYFNVYGERMASGGYATVLQKFKDQKDKGQPLQIFGGGKQKRDFTFVGDVVDANLLMMNQNEFGIYDVGSGQNYSILQIAESFNHPIEFGEGFVGRDETLANIEPIKKLGYKSKVNVLNWIKDEFL